jgi:hypothetical protein
LSKCFDSGECKVVPMIIIINFFYEVWVILTLSRSHDFHINTAVGRRP